MALKLKVNIAHKTKTFICVLAYQYARNAFPDAVLETENVVDLPELSLPSGEVAKGTSAVTAKLFEIAQISAEKGSNPILNTNLAEIVGKLGDKKTLPDSCAFLVEKVFEGQPKQFLANGRISSADLLVWTALYENSRWNALKKNRETFGPLVDWFDALQRSNEVSDALEFMSPPKDEASPTENAAVNKNYASLNVGIDPSMRGKVVTRFPPEPSGFLHIGHVKAAILNATVAELWGGRMILRFDDTNPTKERAEYVESILADLESIRVTPWRTTHTSDYFPLLMAVCEQLLRAGRAYAEDTPKEQMRKERLERVESANRANGVERNLEMWREMVRGEKMHIVRLKLDMASNNGTLRDPTIYRCNAATPHLRTKDRFKVYPTYDLAIAVVDTVEGVTNTFRSNEYNDRDEQYRRVWAAVFGGKGKSPFAAAVQTDLAAAENPFLAPERLKALVPKIPRLKTFSRVNFVKTVLSKRKLTWFVETGRVSGWDDPRMPTVRGMLRQGLTVEALLQFTLSQGFSLNENMMHWSKLWSVNKRVLDPIAKRYTAIEKEGVVRLRLRDGPRLGGRMVPLHPKNEELGEKVIRVGSEILIERVDAEFLAEGEEVTLVEWGNVFVESVNLAESQIIGRMSTNQDFKTTRKITWLADSGEDLVSCVLIETSPLITVDKPSESEPLESVAAEDTWKETKAFGDPNLRNLGKGEIVQLQRKAFAVVDGPLTGEARGELRLILVPDSKNKPMVVKKHAADE